MGYKLGSICIYLYLERFPRVGRIYLDYLQKSLINLDDLIASTITIAQSEFSGSSSSDRIDTSALPSHTTNKSEL